MFKYIISYGWKLCYVFWLPLLCQQQLALSYLCQSSQDEALSQVRVTAHQL